MTRRALETTKRLNSRSKQKMMVYGPEPFLNDGPVDKLAILSNFCPFVVFVVLLFRRFAIETEEPRKFQFFEFEMRSAMIAAIAMATHPT